MFGLHLQLACGSQIFPHITPTSYEMTNPFSPAPAISQVLPKNSISKALHQHRGRRRIAHQLILPRAIHRDLQIGDLHGGGPTSPSPGRQHVPSGMFQGQHPNPESYQGQQLSLLQVNHRSPETPNGPQWPETAPDSSATSLATSYTWMVKCLGIHLFL